MPLSEMAQLDAPARIKNLCSQGNAVEVDPNVPLRRYFRSGLEMVRMANVYAEEGSLENAFILYMKFMTLFLEKIRAHPDFSNTTPADKNNNNKKLKEILPKAERIKSSLRERYQREHDAFIKEQQILEDQFVREHEASLRKAAAEREAEEAVRRRKLQEEEIRRELETEERQLNHLADFHRHHPRPAWEDNPPQYDAISDIVYPTASLTFQDTDPSAPSDDDDLSPVLPQQILSPSMPSRELKPSSPNVPSFDRGSKPGSLLGAHTSGKSSGLRSVIVPSELMDKFLSLAQPNTTRNVETCGILAGRLSQNRLLLTHLLVPKQSGTSDSCTTMEEEQLFEIQDKFDLITLGWIHTHPGFQAFLSSVDCHTHCSYQLMMPEAIAIVCAPKYNETGFFTLTPNHGLQYIANCRQSGFHPHPKEPPLFQNADHITLDPKMPLTVIDLRSK